jgi:UDP-N-acetylmuramyl pentapeptide phosphotransferase/UDP-N-acetylglucosamine-1-phosphate transferase
MTSEYQAREEDKPMDHTKRVDALKAVGLSVLRMTGLFFILAFILSFIPEDQDLKSYGVAVSLVILSGIYGMFLIYQLRGIRHSSHPGIRAAEAAISSAFLFLAMFATVYVIISINSAGSFTEDLTTFSALYYAMTVMSTVGFGDITPTTVPARLATMLQMALGLIYLGVVVRVFATVAKNRKSQS